MALTASAQRPVTTLPHNHGTHPVTVTVVDWPSEMTWEIKDATTGAVVCERPHAYSTYGKQPTEACSLTEGDYKVNCHDNEYDGWHGGFLEVDGHEFCLHFDDGHLKVEDLKVGSDALPITQK